MNAPRRKPENNETNAARQRRLREHRKELGFKRVSIWLSPDQVDRMERLGGEPWLGTRVKQLLESAVSEPARPPAKQVALFLVPDPEIRNGCVFEPEPAAAPVSDNAPALWREADSLNKAGLSWAEIARQWNEQGRRTEKGAEYRGANISREVRKLKGEGE
jgi:hypothetical protein